jgi:hypothetical protein
MGVNLRGQLTSDLPPDLESMAGHAGHCAKVTTATVTGRTDAACTCKLETCEAADYGLCPVCSPAGPCEGHWMSK